VDRYGRHDDVAEIERGSLTSVIAFEFACQTSGGPGDRRPKAEERGLTEADVVSTVREVRKRRAQERPAAK